MKSTTIASIGGALGLLVLLGASVGRVASSADSTAEGMASDPMAGSMELGVVVDGMEPDAMAGGMGPGGTLSDGEIAMVAVVAGNTDIAYAHLALALSSSADVRRFARTMLQDHAAVNEQAGALVSQLGVEPVESDLSRQLQEQARTIIDELTALRGAAFDRRYAENELAYHEFVNTALRDQFIPAAQNEEFREALKGALELFEAHEKLARDLVDEVGA